MVEAPAAGAGCAWGRGADTVKTSEIAGSRWFVAIEYRWAENQLGLAADFGT